MKSKRSPNVGLLQAADLHVGGFRYAYEYLERTEICLDAMYDTVVEQSKLFDHLIFCVTGDFQHCKGMLEPERKLSFRFLYRVAKLKNVTIVMINGNHEYFDHTGTTMLDVFNETSVVVKNLIVVTNNPRVVELDVAGATVSLLCVPCQQHLTTKTMAGILSKLESTAQGEYIYAVIHECFTGSKNEAGYAYKSSLEISESNNILGYLLGDIHMRQRIGTRAYYCGSPWQTRFDETNANKGVLVWAIGSSEPEYVRITGVPKLVETDDVQRVEKLANTSHSVRYTGLTPLAFTAPNVTHVPKVEKTDVATLDSEGEVVAVRDINDIRAVTSVDLRNGVEEYLTRKGKLSPEDVEYGARLVEEAIKGLGI